MASKNSIIAAGADGWMFRNRVINGDMRIDQRNEGASVNSGNGYTCDRWALISSQSLKFTWQRVVPGTGSPTGLNSLFQITTSAAYTPTASDYFQFYQNIEGTNVVDLHFGQTTAQAVTLSFWAQSSIAGLFSVAINNGAGSRSYVTTYTISTANTWQYVAITIPGDTAGTWQIAPAIAGLQVSFDLGCGSTASTSSPNTWLSGSYSKANGTVSIVATSGATFLVTGVQLEAGTVATPFEIRPYEVELARCQRYFYKTWSKGQAVGYGSGAGACAILQYTPTAAASIYSIINYPVKMMASPTVSFYDGAGTINKISAYTTAWSNGVAATVGFNGGTDQSIVASTSVSNANYYNFNLTAQAEL